MSSPFVVNGPETASSGFLFAHGAGAPMDSDFMETVANGLASRGVRVIRFEFPYMAKRRIDGKKRPPDRQPILVQSFVDALEALPRSVAKVYIGGKSMGGRMATLLTADTLAVEAHDIAGCICFGYPFHAPGKPMGNRMDHFSSLVQPLLICQGTRDPFGGQEELARYSIPKKAKICWIEDGDHDLKPRKASGRTHSENIVNAIDRAAHLMTTDQI